MLRFLLQWALGLLLVGNAVGNEDWLAIEWSVVGDLVEHDDKLFACIALTLRPEETAPQYELSAEIDIHFTLPDLPDLATTECTAAGGGYMRVDRLREFVNGAVGGDDTTEECDADEQETAIAGDNRSNQLSSPLGRAIQEWNDRFFNMDTAATRQNAVRFHGRGSESKHLAQEVSHFVMPKDVQGRINERLKTNRKMLFGDDGVGQGGTTGAHFLSGNVGFGNSNQGASVMDTIFPLQNSSGDYSAKANAHASSTSNSSVPKATLFDGDGYARKRGGDLFGDKSTINGESEGQILAPDLKAYEDEVKSILMRRSDVHYALGDNIDFKFQHRLWRYGPNFDPKAKGGIWHKDTCPFGINGALPPGALMFTIVYILYTENLNGPTAGTRVRDEDGTVYSLPCIAGEGNIIRSGESDNNAFFHSGPLNIQKLNKTRPAYRLMLQSKAVLQANEWDDAFRVIPTKGNWRGLRIASMPTADDDSVQGQLESLRTWMREASIKLTAGVGESNAVGFEAYPIGVHRAWEVTRDLCKFVGIKTAGFLPETDTAHTPVVIFGFDARYTEGLVNTLSETGNFRVLVVASDAEFAEMRNERQDKYANMETADIKDIAKVTTVLLNSAFDVHIVVDVPPIGFRAVNCENTSAYSSGVMGCYGDVLEQMAAKGVGEGRLASVTVLSQQMPFHGRDTAGKIPTPADSDLPLPVLSATQEAFLKEESSWLKFGEQTGVRTVMMRVADRVVAHHDSALHFSYSGVVATENPKYNCPCRVRLDCTEHTPVSRIHAEDLANVVLRMLSMFDIVETHGADSSMRGSATMASSIERFPSGTALDVVDDGEPDSMVQAEAWAALMMGKQKACEVCNAGKQESKTELVHGSVPGSNRDLKDALGMPNFNFPTYRHGGAKLFGVGEV